MAKVEHILKESEEEERQISRFSAKASKK